MACICADGAGADAGRNRAVSNARSLKGSPCAYHRCCNGRVVGRDNAGDGIVALGIRSPDLARNHANPATSAEAQDAAERAFELLNAYGGVAIGEHLGQLLTAAFVLALAALQRLEGRRYLATVGFLTAALIAIGTSEGLALALGRSGELFSLTTIAGFLGLTAWLFATGITRLRMQSDR